MKLPERYQTRLNYVITAVILSLPWSILLSDGTFAVLDYAWVFLPPIAGGLAWLCWAGEDRPATVLMMSAATIVAGTLCAAGFIVGLSFFVLSLGGEEGDAILQFYLLCAPFITAFGGLILGTIGSLGLPYATMIAGSLLFRNEPD